MNDEFFPKVIPHLDSCVFNPDDEVEARSAQEIFQMHEDGEFPLSIAHSTEKEIEHPNTPHWVKRKATELLYTYELSLTAPELQRLKAIEEILTGNANREKHKQDAMHVFEAQKYCGEFITTDKRILKKRDELRKICSVKILKPSEFIEWYKIEKQRLQRVKKRLEELKKGKRNDAT